MAVTRRKCMGRLWTGRAPSRSGRPACSEIKDERRSTSHSIALQLQPERLQTNARVACVQRAMQRAVGMQERPLPMAASSTPVPVAWCHTGHG